MRGRFRKPLWWVAGFGILAWIFYDAAVNGIYGQ